MQLSDAEIERLRQSGIRLDGEGRFWHEGAQVTHPGLRAALFRWLDRNPDGRYVLRLDERRFVYLDVDDVPFVVRSLRWQAGRPVGVLSDGSEEELDLASLRLRGDPVEGVYVTLARGLLARLSTSAWSTLTERLRECDDGWWLDGGDGASYRIMARFNCVDPLRAGKARSPLTRSLRDTVSMQLKRAMGAIGRGRVTLGGKRAFGAWWRAWGRRRS